MDEPEPPTQRLDQLMDDFLGRTRRGESPAIEDYATRHPDLATQIRELFPALAVVEGSAAESTGDEATPTFPGLELVEASEPAVGGMGKVYKAREISLDRIVAVKTTLAHLDTQEGRAFFEREARAAAKLDHPHIVRVFSFHPTHQPPYYVMQFVEGRPLQEACLGRDARFLAEVLEKIARALFYAHGMDVVHRDIKPHNILVDYENEPHITDFGLAKSTQGVLQASSAGETTSLRGTPYYIAPELLEAGGKVTPATDIYALGVTMYVLLTGRQPFTARGIPELYRTVREDNPQLPKDIDPEIPGPLQRICLKAMERDPAHRYASAKMMADDLRRFLDGREVFARPTCYLRERSGRLENHLTDIRLWHSQNLIDTREMDRLSRPYYGQLEADSAWDELSRRFPWETALLRLGGWLAVVSSVLWVTVYWDDLARWQRVIALALPCLLVNLAGWMYHHRGSRLNAVVFLSTGSLLLPMLVAVFLAEYGWVQLPQDPLWELFGFNRLEPDRTGFVLTNFQANLSAAVFLAYALVLLARVRAKMFGLWVGAGAYVLYATVLLLFGLRFWMENHQIARATLTYLPMCLLFVPLAAVLRRRGQVGLVAIFYSFFPIPFAALMTLLARFGGQEWLGSPGSWDDRPTQLWLMANGALYLALGMRHKQAHTGLTRFWGELFMLLVPISLLVPTHVLFEEGPYFGTAGGLGIGLFEYAAVVISVFLVVYGTRIRRGVLIMSGAFGLATAVLRVTERHFADVLAWPLMLALLGGLAMVVGAGLTFVRSRKKTT